jgi:hypothetical protein
VKVPLKNLLDGFFNGNLGIDRINYGTITLIPKSEDAMEISKFRLICLMNTNLKIIIKRMNNRLAPIVDRTQTTFMENRFIMEVVSMLHEIIHVVKMEKKCHGCFSKLILKNPLIM